MSRQITQSASFLKRFCPITRGLRVNFALLALILSLVSSSAGDTTATNWTTMKFGPFSIQVPPGMTNIPIRGVDCMVGKCESTNILLMFEYRWYRDDSLKEHSFKGSTLVESTIDGRAAELFSYRVGPTFPGGERRTNVVSVSFSKFGEYGQSALSMNAYCHGEPDLATAKRIFESIRVKRE